MTAALPDRSALEHAARELGRYLHRTPLVPSAHLSAETGAEVRLKAENLQRSGSFKARGAHRWLLTRGEIAAGVVTFSSGNHGQAVALAARNLGVKAVVVVPTHVSRCKAAAIEGYGAELVLEGETSHQRRSRAERIAAERGLEIMPPFDDPEIVTGQGTVGLEILEDWPEVERIVVPVGGGGLLAGILRAVAVREAEVEVVAVEPEGAPVLHRSLAAGERIVFESPDSIADGLLPVQIGVLNFEIASTHPTRSLVVSDEEIRGALRRIIERTKVVVEPSGAAALAGLLTNDLPPKRTAVVLSGGNVDLDRLAALLT